MSNEDKNFDVDNFLSEMEDYTSDNDALLAEFLATDDGNIPDESINEDLDGGVDFDAYEQYAKDDDNEPDEQDVQSFLKNYTISDNDLEEVELEDYNIQEDIVLVDNKKSFPIKDILFVILFCILVFITTIAVVFFNKYTLVTEKVKNNIWTNETYSVMPKDYIVDFNDVYYGVTVMYCEDKNAFIKEYRYLTIIDDKMKSPRSIKAFDNETGSSCSVSIEDIVYIVDTDINENISPPSENNEVTIETETNEEEILEENPQETNAENLE